MPKKTNRIEAYYSITKLINLAYRDHMKFSFLFPVCALTFLFTSPVKADVYKCITASGKVITSDRVIPECANRNTKVFKNNGVLKKEIAPPLTAEEKIKIAEEKEKKRVEEEAEIAKQKEERFLLAHYSNEKDIQNARQKAIDTYLEKKKLSTEQLLTLKKSYADLDEKIKKTPEGSSNLASLKVRHAELSTSIFQGETSLKAYDAEILNINRRFDETVNRFRTIIGRK